MARSRFGAAWPVQDEPPNKTRHAANHGSNDGLSSGARHSLQRLGRPFGHNQPSPLCHDLAVRQAGCLHDDVSLALGSSFLHRRRRRHVHRRCLVLQLRHGLARSRLQFFAGNRLGRQDPERNQDNGFLLSASGFFFGVSSLRTLYSTRAVWPPFSPAISKVTGTLPGAEHVLPTMSPKGSMTKAPAFISLIPNIMITPRR